MSGIATFKQSEQLLLFRRDVCAIIHNNNYAENMIIFPYNKNVLSSRQQQFNIPC